MENKLMSEKSEREQKASEVMLNEEKDYSMIDFSKETAESLAAHLYDLQC